MSTPPSATQGTAAVSSLDQVREAALYPRITAALCTQFGLLGARIDERMTTGRGIKNKWTHPDLVAAEDTLSCIGDLQVRNACREIGHGKVRLWALEVKLELTRQNVREA